MIWGVKSTVDILCKNALWKSPEAFMKNSSMNWDKGGRLQKESFYIAEYDLLFFYSVG